MLKMMDRLNKALSESKAFWGDVTFTKFEDGELGICLTHRNHYYKYDNTSIRVFDFQSLEELNEFERLAIDCIQNNTILEEY